jgi:C4-dicarboxylate-specific signal transduction histidine kinase
MAGDERKLRESQIESYGRLMAGFSHDMKNHLGIIRESAGLMADLVEINAAQMDPVLVERFKKTTDLIEKRVVIAAGLFHHLSSFAHRSDTPISSFALSDVVAEMAAFIERPARLRQVKLELKNDADAVLLNSPSLLQFLFYRLYMHCLDQLGEGDTLTLEASGVNGAAVLRMDGGGKLTLAGFPGEEEATALSLLGGDIFEENGIVLKLGSVVD